MYKLNFHGGKIDHAAQTDLSVVPVLETPKSKPVTTNIRVCITSQ